jgi:hypothetical protein
LAQAPLQLIVDLNVKELAAYLNDHFAGSIAAIELLDHLAKEFDGQRLGTFFREVRDDVRADQDVLRGLMEKLGVEESGLRKAGAWILEKVGQAKLNVSGNEAGGLGLLQALEGLALGITGKQLLWRSLATAARNSAKLQGMDFTRLEQRAKEQFERVEAERLKAASEAFSR